LANEDIREACTELVCLVFSDSDPAWLQQRCLALFDHPSHEIRAFAITCLGHIARIHRTLDLEAVLPELERMRADREGVSIRIDDALDDISMFARG